MLNSQNVEENLHYNFPDLDFDYSFSLLNKMAEDFNNNNEFKLVIEENISFLNKIENKFKKKEIIFNIKKINKEKKRKENKSVNELKNDNINNSMMGINKFKTKIFSDVVYRKDAYYKHFKVNLGKFIRDRMNSFKNKCFPFYYRNNFSTPNYVYIGNPKEKDNFIYLSFKIKDIMIKGRDKALFNRQYNNDLIIKFIEENENKAVDKDSYNQLIKFLNENLEETIIQFYNDENEYKKINSNKKCIYFDKFYKRETGISLLEKYGFLKALKKYD